MTKVPSAILGCSTSQAPSKKRKALLSEAAPAYRYSGLPVPVALSTRYWRLCLANRNAVEGDIVIDGIGVADQAVVGDHLDACGSGFISSGGSSGGILRADDDDFDALGDQSFNVGFFLGGIALAEEDLDGVPGSLEGIFETGFVLDPARLILGRKNNTNSYLADLIYSFVKSAAGQ